MDLCYYLLVQDLSKHSYHCFLSYWCAILSLWLGWIGWALLYVISRDLELGSDEYEPGLDSLGLGCNRAQQAEVPHYGSSVVGVGLNIVDFRQQVLGKDWQIQEERNWQEMCFGIVLVMIRLLERRPHVLEEYLVFDFDEVLELVQFVVPQS